MWSKTRTSVKASATISWTRAKAETKADGRVVWSETVDDEKVKDAKTAWEDKQRLKELQGAFDFFDLDGGNY